MRKGATHDKHVQDARWTGKITRIAPEFWSRHRIEGDVEISRAGGLIGDFCLKQLQCWTIGGRAGVFYYLTKCAFTWRGRHYTFFMWNSHQILTEVCQRGVAQASESTKSLKVCLLQAQSVFFFKTAPSCYKRHTLWWGSFFDTWSYIPLFKHCNGIFNEGSRSRTS